MDFKSNRELLTTCINRTRKLKKKIKILRMKEISLLPKDIDNPYSVKMFQTTGLYFSNMLAEMYSPELQKN